MNGTLVSGVALLEQMVAAAISGRSDIVIAAEDGTAVVAVSSSDGVIVKASSASTRGPAYLGMAERARIVSAEHAALVVGYPEPIAELVTRGLLTSAAVDALSVLVASVDFGKFLAARGKAAVSRVATPPVMSPAAPSVSASGVVVSEFLKQAIIVCGDVGAMLDAVAVDAQDMLQRGAASDAPADPKTRQLLDALAPRLPAKVHEALALAGDDLTRRKVGATIVTALATGHLKRIASSEVVKAPEMPLPRLSSFTGVIALDLAQATAGAGAAPASTRTPVPDVPRAGSTPPPPVRAVTMTGPELRAVAPSTAASSWRKETLREHQLRRAADLHIDLDNAENATSLEREYLGIVVPRGLAAGAADELLSEAKRWLELSPQDPTAIVSCARVRWAAEAKHRSEVLESLAAASAAFPGVVDVHWTLFELASSVADKERIAVARRRFLAVASPTDPRRSTMGSPAQRALAETDGAAVAWAAIAVLAVPVLTTLALQGLTAQDLAYHPMSLPWVLRHGILVLATLGLILAGGAGHRQATAEALKRFDVAWFVVALVGGAVTQGLVVLLFGTSVRPVDLVFGIAVATGIVHAIIERAFFHLAVAPMAGEPSGQMAGLALSIVGQGLMVVTYLGLWQQPHKLVMWAGAVVLSVAMPTALLWMKSRSFFVPLAWQVAMVPVQLALLSAS